MTFGIIAEYNPFHNGHFYHIAKSREITNSDNCVVVMSGNFVQRGEPALLNKQIRTKYALLNGASIVLELPVPFATGSADIFSFGAIDILKKSNIIDYLCFGVETENIDLMKSVSNILISEPKFYKESLKTELSKGISYPLARENALKKYIENTSDNISLCSLDFLKSPNNILALEYIKSLNKLNSNIKPIAIKRKGNHFHSKELTEELSSATSIRTSVEILKNDKDIENSIKKALPENIHKSFFEEIANYPKLENYMQTLDYILRTTTKEDLSKILDITEGLENRFLKYATEKSIDSMLLAIKNKRYTLSKLRHCLIHILLNIKKSDIEPYLETGLPYIRVLGFRKDKKHLLSELVEKSSVPVITNIKSAEKQLNKEAYKLLEKEIHSSNLYYMQTTKEINSEYTKPIVIV